MNILTWLQPVDTDRADRRVLRSLGFTADDDQVNMLRSLRPPHYLHTDAVTMQTRVVNIEDVPAHHLSAGVMVTGTGTTVAPRKA